MLTQTIWYTHMYTRTYACKYLRAHMGIETPLTQSADTDAFILVSHGDWHCGQFIKEHHASHLLREGEQLSLVMFIHYIQHTATAHIKHSTHNQQHTIDNTTQPTKEHTTHMYSTCTYMHGAQRLHIYTFTYILYIYIIIYIYIYTWYIYTHSRVWRPTQNFLHFISEFITVHDALLAHTGR